MPPKLATPSSNQPLSSGPFVQHWRNKLTISRAGAFGDDKEPKAKKPSSTRKYVCPCCGQSIQATKEVNIMCMMCMDCLKQMTAGGG